MIIARIDPPSLAPIPGARPTSSSPKASGLVFISGQTGVGADGQVVGPTHYEQMKQAFLNLVVTLDAAGTDVEVCKLTFYVVDYDDAAFEALVTAALEVFGEEIPLAAATLIGVARLWQPEVLFEVDAIAIF